MACTFSEPVEKSHSESEPYCTENKCGIEPDYTPTIRPTSPREPCKENPMLQPSLDTSAMRFECSMKSCAEAIQTTSSIADYDQRKNSELLELRARDVATWKGTVEGLVSKMREEINLLTEQKMRLQRSLTALMVPEQIVAECRSRRTCRTGYDLVEDMVDRVLSEEERLCSEVRDVLTLNLKETISQLESDQICKVQLEYDWSDKSDAYRLETINVGLTNHGPVSFHPGATRLQSNQATPEHWIHYTKELIDQGLSVKARSAALRKLVHEEITRSVNDLRAKADNVELTLQRNIAAAELSLQESESELNRVLGEITKAETLHGKLAHLARQIDFNLKTSQTRLDNRSQRLRAENTRDPAQYGLITEVKHINEHAARIKLEMDKADATLQTLYKSRALLEDKIAVKRKTIYIDRVRCIKSRSKYPDTATLSGFTT